MGVISMPFPEASSLPNPSDAPARPDLRWEELQTKSVEDLIKTLSDATYWRQLCPDLHVDDAAFQNAAEPAVPRVGDEEINTLKERMNHEGYFPCTTGMDRVAMEELARQVVLLTQYGWPPSFLVIFDEIWRLVKRMELLMDQTSGNRMNMDILIWMIDPNRQQSGFSPHRDRQPEDAGKTFREDGSPHYTTCWMPFTDACPENSCLYVIPAWADPGYRAGDRDDQDPLQVALPNKEAYQNIRALPLAAGSAVMFTHRIIHWGSAGRAGYHTPRIACSFAGADDSFETSYFSREHLPYPPLSLRVALMAGQMLIYYQRFGFSSRELSLFYKIFKSQVEHFDAGYAQKVQYEFVQSVKEAALVSSAQVSSPSVAAVSSPKRQAPPAEEQDSDEDDAMEEALDAMLEAKASGFEGFDDDFDELSDTDLPIEDQDDEEEDEEEEGEAFF